MLCIIVLDTPDVQKKYKELKGKMQWHVLRWPQDRWQKLGRELTFKAWARKGHTSERRDIRAITITEKGSSLNSKFNSFVVTEIKTLNITL